MTPLEPRHEPERADGEDTSRAVLDVRIDTPGREGLTGTTPANLYTPAREPEQITIAPDGRPMEDQPAWRTDFPIDWPHDQYVERREFMKFLVLTSLAFTAGQLWIGVQNWWRRRRGQMEMRPITTLASLPVGGVLTFAYPGPHDDCVIVRPAADVLVAYSQKCTHLSCAVLPRVEQGIIECPCHDGSFDLASGRPLAGPPRRPLPRVHVEVRAGQVYAVGVEERTV